MRTAFSGHCGITSGRLEDIDQGEGLPQERFVHFLGMLQLHLGNDTFVTKMFFNGVKFPQKMGQLLNCRQIRKG